MTIKDWFVNMRYAWHSRNAARGLREKLAYWCIEILPPNVWDKLSYEAQSWVVAYRWSERNPRPKRSIPWEKIVIAGACVWLAGWAAVAIWLSTNYGGTDTYSTLPTLTATTTSNGHRVVIRGCIQEDGCVQDYHANGTWTIRAVTP